MYMNSIEYKARCRARVTECDVLKYKYKINEEFSGRNEVAG